MKIALVHYSCAPVIGGVETVVAAHARLFAAAGHEVRLVVRRGGEGDPHVVRLFAEEPLAELRAAISNFDAVIVHNVMTMPFDLQLTSALRTVAAECTLKCRFIAWVHDLAASNGDYRLPVHKAPWQQLARAADGFEYIAISEHRAQEFAALTGKRARVIPNGVNPATVLGLTENVAQFARAEAIFARDVVLFHPTRLLPRKNVELGLAVTAELRARGRDAVYLATAAPNAHQRNDVSYADALRRTQVELGLEKHAFFLTDKFAVTSADLTALYALSDVLFFPSHHEGFGLPVLEAALHRLPIFCPDIAPMNALIEHALHPFTEDATPAEIAASIERTLDLCTPYRARREVLRRYAWETIDRDYLQPLLAETLPT